MVKTHRLGDITVVVCLGNIKLGDSATEFAREITRALEGSPKGIIVDMSDLRFMDSIGVGELVGALTSAMAMGKLFAISGLHPPLTGLFGEVTELRTIFPAFPSVDEAVAALAPLTFAEYLERSRAWVYHAPVTAKAGTNRDEKE